MGWLARLCRISTDMNHIFPKTPMETNTCEFCVAETINSNKTHNRFFPTTDPTMVSYFFTPLIFHLFFIPFFDWLKIVLSPFFGKNCN